MKKMCLFIRSKLWNKRLQKSILGAKIFAAFLTECIQLKKMIALKLRLLVNLCWIWAKSFDKKNPETGDAGISRKLGSCYSSPSLFFLLVMVLWDTWSWTVACVGAERWMNTLPLTVSVPLTWLQIFWGRGLRAICYRKTREKMKFKFQL